MANALRPPFKVTASVPNIGLKSLHLHISGVPAEQMRNQLLTQASKGVYECVDYTSVVTKASPFPLILPRIL